MFVKSLRLKDFRNYETAETAFEPGISFIVGPNGSGKTNLVEAVYFLSLSRSFKKCADGDLIRSGASQAELGLEYLEEAGEETGEHSQAALIAPKAKAFYLDGEKAPQLSRVIGRLLAVSYDPGSVFLFREDPQERRRFLDETIASLSKGYLYTLGRYKKILRERNAALAREVFDDDVMRVLTDELITGDYIIARQRRGLVDGLESKARKIFAELEPGRTLTLDYRTGLPNTVDQESFRIEVSRLFERCRSEERIKKRTLIGIHRDDLAASLDGQPLGTYCSQGQNRLASFALKLAVAELMEELRGEKPLIILDDVLSDLDQERCGRILKALEGRGQVLITLADRAKTELAPGAAVYEIDNSHVTRRR